MQNGYSRKLWLDYDIDLDDATESAKHRAAAKAEHVVNEGAPNGYTPIRRIITRGGVHATPG